MPLLDSIDAVPPTSRGTPCTMLSKVTGAQECDPEFRFARRGQVQGTMLVAMQLIT